MTNLWQGRFSKSMDASVAAFNASIGFDHVLYPYDIRGSIAHATMLGEQGIITTGEAEQIVEALKTIEADIDAGNVQWRVEDEDIHMAIEGRLIQMLGDTGKKLHTARSRNDQVNVDMRLYLKDAIGALTDALIDFESVLLEKTSTHAADLMPGVTHLQNAQPVTIGFHLMAYFQKFKRDIERLADCLKRVDICPLGACALAGTTLPIDRQRTAELLGFSAVSDNAMDTVSDRDFITEFLACGALCITHLSRFSEEFILWNAQPFGYIDIDDSFCTGSSIMPQKKNPDIAELIRGKSGRVYGNLMALLTVSKGQPLAFNKDFQEDKEALFDTVETLRAAIPLFARMLEKTQFKTDVIERHLTKGFINATDIAEHFVVIGIPFRSAHELVGKMVRYCEANDLLLEHLQPADFPKIDAGLSADMLPDLSLSACVTRRTSYGGTAPVEVLRQIEAGRNFLAAIKAL